MLQCGDGAGSTSARRCARDRASCAEAIGVTIKHNGLALDRAPFELRARIETPEIVIGPRIGITKAVDEPWRYGLQRFAVSEQAVLVSLGASAQA